MTRGGRWDALFTWHALLVAGGNFKRQAPIYPPELPDPEGSPDSFTPPDRFVLPATRAELVWNDSDSWAVLTAIDGVGVPTATTIMSVLWPEHHAIMDRLALSAAIALAGRQGSWDLVESTSVRPASTEWMAYEWYRQMVEDTAKLEKVTMQEVERALYLAARDLAAAERKAKVKQKSAIGCSIKEPYGRISLRSEAIA